MIEYLGKKVSKLDLMRKFLDDVQEAKDIAETFSDQVCGEFCYMAGRAYSRLCEVEDFAMCAEEMYETGEGSPVEDCEEFEYGKEEELA